MAKGCSFGSANGATIERQYFANEASGTCCGGASQARFTSGFAVELNGTDVVVRRLNFDGAAAIVGFTARGVPAGTVAPAGLLIKIVAGQETITDTSFDTGAGDGFVPSETVDLLVRRTPLVLEAGQKLEVSVRDFLGTGMSRSVAALFGVVWARIG